MANPPRSQHLRQMIAQQAARMMAEEGAQDYAYAKRKAARQLGATDDRCLPTNTEIEQELKLYHAIYRSEEQPHHLQQLRREALEVMHRLEQFNPHLAGAVLDGTAGRYAETEIHLFVDSLKDVELYLLNHRIPYQMEDRPYRAGPSHQRLPVFTLESAHGTIRILVFATEDLRTLPRNATAGVRSRAPLHVVEKLVEESILPAP